MKNRRNFIKNIGMTTIGSLMLNQELGAHSFEHITKNISHSLIPDNDDFWGWVRSNYTVSSTLLNLNNGGVSPQPKVVQEALFRYTELSNEAPSYYMWRTLEDGKQVIRKKLADMLDANENEVAINRNATEALDTIIHGFPLKKGDEVVLSKYDYPRMMHAWKFREKRDGIVLKWVDFDFPEKNPEQIIEKYTSLFTSKTKLVHLTHMINWVGQVIPVKEITKVAHDQGIKVLVDAAHSFAQIEFSVKDWDCDFLGTSLHKWLCAPFGTGMLYIKKDLVSMIDPFFTPDQTMLSDDIKKFEELGTRSTPAEIAIGKAIDFHQIIGTKRKQERLYYLKQFWVDRVRNHPKIKIYTPDQPVLSGALGFFSIDGMDHQAIDSALMSKYKIHTVGIKYEKLNGVRVAPNVYTSTDDLNRFVDAVLQIADGK
jgi:selenocysteine lyase/cysteine desulfurase